MIPTVARLGAASARVATAATAPVRSAVTERASSSISGSPVVASERQMTPHHGRQPARRVAGERGDPLQQRQPVAAGRHRPEVAERRALEVDLGRHRPVAGVEAQERVADALDRLGRRDRAEDGVVSRGRAARHRAGTIPSAGADEPPPQLTIVAPGASPEEAAAVVAALERFMRDTAPPPAPPRAAARTRGSAARGCAEPVRRRAQSDPSGPARTVSGHKPRPSRAAGDTVGPRLDVRGRRSARWRVTPAGAKTR